jgi:hypothetical protein
MCRTLYSAGTELPYLVCLQVRKNVSLVEHDAFFELRGKIYSRLIISWYGSVYSKKTFLFDTLFPLAHSLAEKFRDCTKSTESKWLEQFLQQTVLCVSVKRNIDQSTAKVFFSVLFNLKPLTLMRSLFCF